MSRLILLTGVGGAGTSTLAEATVSALRDEGISAVLIDGSGESPPDPATMATVGDPVGQLFAELGADPVAPEAWSGLPGLRHLSTLGAAAAAVTEHDAVVVDAGPLAHARELVELPGVLTRLLDAALTPRLAMWRSARGEDVAFDALSSARVAAVRLGALLARPTTTARLVTTATMPAASRTATALSVISALGVGVDGVIVNRYPRAKDEVPGSVRREADEALSYLSAVAEPVPVWTSTTRLRPAPKGRSALGPIGRVQVLDEEQLVVRLDGDGDGFALDLPLAHVARRDARVGTQGEHLVVEVAGAYRWIPLPPVLRRCLPTHATRTADGLRLSFTPDPQAWRQPAAEEEPS